MHAISLVRGEPVSNTFSVDLPAVAVITLVLEQGLGRLTFRNSERFYTANLSDQA
jgi:hypothetical protein